MAATAVRPRTGSKGKTRRPAAVPVLDSKLLKVLSSPHRLAVLHAIGETGEKGISAKGYADRAAMPLSNVAYYFKALREGGLTTTVRTVPRRGALERFVALSTTGSAALNFAEAIARVRP